MRYSLSIPNTAKFENAKKLSRFIGNIIINLHGLKINKKQSMEKMREKIKL